MLGKEKERKEGRKEGRMDGGEKKKWKKRSIGNLEEKEGKGRTERREGREGKDTNANTT